MKESFQRARQFAAKSWGKTIAIAFFCAVIRARFPHWFQLAIGSAIVGCIVSIAAAVSYHNVSTHEKRGRTVAWSATLFTFGSLAVQLVENLLLQQPAGFLTSMAGAANGALPKPLLAPVVAIQYVAAVFVVTKMAQWTVAICNPDQSPS